MNKSNERASWAYRYRPGRWLRDNVVRVIAWLTPKQSDAALLAGDPSIRRILLVRMNFRMGNALLTLPAIAAVKTTFPHAEIDFLGSPISALLFRDQSLHRHYVAPRRFPRLLWEYPRLLRQLRAQRYDLLVDVSCSQSGAAMFVIGLSGARIRAGLAGRADRVLNVRVAKLRYRNKYQKMTEFLGRLNFSGIAPVGALALSSEERKRGHNRLETLGVGKNGRIVGVFIGGRKLRRKRWPAENFLHIIGGLKQHGYDVVVFLGPEEADMVEPFKSALDRQTPLVFEPEVRTFAAIVSHLDLFVSCDSGPMHLACALGVRVVAIFQPGLARRWGPPANAARIVEGSPADVLMAVLEELSPSLIFPNTTPVPITAIS